MCIVRIIGQTAERNTQQGSHREIGMPSSPGLLLGGGSESTHQHVCSGWPFSTWPVLDWSWLSLHWHSCPWGHDGQRSILLGNRNQFCNRSAAACVEWDEIGWPKSRVNTHWGGPGRQREKSVPKGMQTTPTAQSWAGNWERMVASQQRSSTETGSGSPRTKAELPMGSQVSAGLNEVCLVKE